MTTLQFAALCAVDIILSGLAVILIVLGGLYVWDRWIRR
jgi:hypothetical protein